MAFEALELSLQLIEALVKPVAKIARHDPDLAKQIRRAATSMPLNLAEGGGRSGNERSQHNRYAQGSVREVGAGLRTAKAWTYVDQDDIEDAMKLVDRMRAITWRLTH